ncbi:hypothetical protein AMAG_11620 [Allomyces macrogynus ATCC 38327]|uniref:H/ACA ribonucleoprotein complex non-core subunit NAF1 n=1 Tax=Allomyces macrogynus (strain ATCC 38327) TaxID=578462 RepID=A0A0L0SVG1_ALLM3|nr:hypothetical protein AMAG_11620 [Allomyces macrogynus ATCC 38327]|eukprot:KNE66482.1 hypothetical protein AMAG_11620 [Allomyces macrogynus ATCC 38327]
MSDLQEGELVLLMDDEALEEGELDDSAMAMDTDPPAVDAPQQQPAPKTVETVQHDVAMEDTPATNSTATVTLITSTTCDSDSSDADDEDSDSDSDASDSSSDSNSDSDDSDIDDDDEFLRNLATVSKSNGLDDEEDGGATVRSGPATQNEIKKPVIEPVDIPINEHMHLEYAGVVQAIVEDQVVVAASQPGTVRVLDDGTVMVLEDRSVLGRVWETFGPVASPLHSIRFSSPADIDRERIAIGKKVFFIPDYSVWALTEQLKSMKGSDASNMYDEEVNEEDMEFSDDEKEMAHRAALKQARRARHAANAGDAPHHANQHGQTSKRPRHGPPTRNFGGNGPSTPNAEPFRYQPLGRGRGSVPPPAPPAAAAAPASGSLSISALFDQHIGASATSRDPWAEPPRQQQQQQRPSRPSRPSGPGAGAGSRSSAPAAVSAPPNPAPNSVPTASFQSPAHQSPALPQQPPVQQPPQPQSQPQQQSQQHYLYSMNVALPAGMLPSHVGGYMSQFAGAPAGFVAPQPAMQPVYVEPQMAPQHGQGAVAPPARAAVGRVKVLAPGILGVKFEQREDGAE